MQNIREINFLSNFVCKNLFILLSITRIVFEIFYKIRSEAHTSIS